MNPQTAVSFLSMPMDVMVQIGCQIRWQILRHTYIRGVALSERWLRLRIRDGDLNLRPIRYFHIRRQSDDAICDFHSTSHNSFA